MSPKFTCFYPEPNYANALAAREGRGFLKRELAVRLFLIVAKESSEGRCFGIPGKRGEETGIEDVLEFHLKSPTRSDHH